MTGEFRQTRLSVVRRSVGVLLAVLAVLAVPAFVAGIWNPWRLVRLQQFLGNPFIGLVVVTFLGAAATWLLAPVRSEAAQSRRDNLRWLLLAAFLLSLPCAGIGYRYFDFDTAEVARSPSGERTVALRTVRDDREARLWVGRGLSKRDVGSLGRPCGEVTVRFAAEDLVHIESVYGNFDIRLDPATARPLNPIGPHCSG